MSSGDDSLPFGSIFFSSFIVWGVFAIIMATAANAQTTTYTYTGNAYDEILIAAPAGICPITGSFTTANPLGPNFEFGDNVPYTSISISDCITTITSPNDMSITVSTNAQGQINAWDVGGSVDGSFPVTVVPSWCAEEGIPCSFTANLLTLETEAPCCDTGTDFAAYYVMYSEDYGFDQAPGVGTWTCSPSCVSSLSGTVNNSAPVPSIISDPFYQKPTTINVTANLPGSADGTVIDFSAAAGDLQSSSGHDHTNLSTVLVGEFGTYDGKLKTSPTGTCKIASGTCTVPFTVSEVAGSYNLVLTQSSSTFTIPITVGFSQLGALSTGSTYSLDPYSPYHPANHYGTSTLTSNIQTVANMYFNYKSTSGQILSINDMSLPIGGLFDISVNGSLPNWTPPHKLHRTGDSVDIDHATAGGQAIKLPLLKGLMKDVGMYQVPEGRSIHFQVTGPAEAVKVGSISTSTAFQTKVAGAQVKALVASSSDGMLTYSYEVSNGLTGSAPVASFQIDLSRSSGTQSAAKGQIVQGAGSLVDYEPEVTQAVANSLVPAGLSGPSGWVGTISADLNANWFAESEAEFLPAGQNGLSFALESPGLPGVRSFQLAPYIDPTKLGIPEPASELSLADYEGRLRSVEDAVKLSGSTVGPVALPSKFDALQFLTTIASYATQANELGWIPTTDYEYVQAQLGLAESQIRAGNFQVARQTLSGLLAGISRLHLSSEGEALLTFNIQYLIGDLQ
jgi:hypothetical protein